MATVTTSADKSLKKINGKRLLVMVLGVCVLLGAGGTYYFYAKYNAIRTNPNIEAQKEIAALVAAVGKLIELPQGEEPTVATVSDKEALKDQPFFKLTENGDKLLAYNVAMVAILYRPSINKIINVAPITLNQPTVAVPTILRVAYYNGSKTIGFASDVEKIVKAVYPEWQTIQVVNATKNTYTQTLVVDLSGKYGQTATDLAAALQGKVGSLPDGETAPDADFLIIAGK
jgi:hypothetical protein